MKYPYYFRNVMQYSWFTQDISCLTPTPPHPSPQILVSFTFTACYYAPFILIMMPSLFSQRLFGMAYIVPLSFFISCMVIVCPTAYEGTFSVRVLQHVQVNISQTYGTVKFFLEIARTHKAILQAHGKWEDKKKLSIKVDFYLSTELCSAKVKLDKWV